MRYMLALAVALTMVGAAGSFAQEKEQARPDFSGEWVLDPEKSGVEEDQEGRRRQGNPPAMIVGQNGKELVVTRLRRGRDGGETKTVLTYSLEGKKTKNKTEFGKMESTARWLDDGASLELYSWSEVRREGMKFTVETFQTWSLADGALVIETVRTTPRGEMKSTAVYERAAKEQ
ncbi:MAG: hypothetical protein PHQ19_00945 [Candidatus Krumholzibacteria bacterium]|nr:hypothetical protein [Candidatus Krumholzibacteria bacterium]